MESIPFHTCKINTHICLSQCIITYLCVFVHWRYTSNISSTPEPGHTMGFLSLDFCFNFILFSCEYIVFFLCCCCIKPRRSTYDMHSFGSQSSSRPCRALVRPFFCSTNWFCVCGDFFFRAAHSCFFFFGFSFIFCVENVEYTCILAWF